MKAMLWREACSELPAYIMLLPSEPTFQKEFQVAYFNQQD